jgi:alkylhydroperoxidase family enzyme
MKRQGFSEEDVWDAMAVTAFFAMSNRLANTAGVKPNAAFYTMGRE